MPPARKPVAPVLNERNNNHTRFGVPGVVISLLSTILVQGFIAIWWAAGISKDVDYLKQTLQVMQANRYTSADASRDFGLAQQRAVEVERRLISIETRLRELEVMAR